MWDKNTPENISEYNNSYEISMNENLVERIITIGDLYINSAVINKDNTDYYIKIDRFQPFIHNQINFEYKIIRVNLFNPSYDPNTDDIFTKKEKEDFLSVINNIWDNIIGETRDLYESWLCINLPKELPNIIPDYSLLPTKD